MPNPKKPSELLKEKIEKEEKQAYAAGLTGGLANIVAFKMGFEVIGIILDSQADQITALTSRVEELEKPLTDYRCPGFCKGHDIPLTPTMTNNEAKNKEDEIEKIREKNALQGWKNRLEEIHDDRMSRYGRDDLN